MVEIKDVIEWGVLIVAALIGGIAGIKIWKRNRVTNSNNKINQSVNNGDGNLLAGGNVTMTKNED